MNRILCRRGIGRVAVAGSFVVAAAGVLGVCRTPTLSAQGVASTSSQRPSAASSFRPIGSPSAVDAYRRTAVDAYRRTEGRPAGSAGKFARPARTPVGQASSARHSPVGRASSTGRLSETRFVSATPSGERAGDGEVRRAVWMQGDGGSLAAPDLPPDGYDYPPSSPPPPTGSGGFGSGLSGSSEGDTSSAAPPVTSPGVTPPRSLPRPSREDYAPMPQPRIGQAGYARVDNCAMVSAPSTYVAASGIGCGSPIAYGPPANSAGPGGYAAPPAEFAAPVVLPPAGGPPVLGATGVRPSPLPPLFTLGQERNPVQVGQGLWGQPVAYVPGQGVRNFLRYWFP